MKPDLHRKVAIGTLALTAASMPFSIIVCHWSFLAFLLNWLLDGRWKEKTVLFSINKQWWIMPLFFLINLAGMLYTSNLSSGWFQIEKKAAFLLVPLALASTERLTRAEIGIIVRTFILVCLAAVLFCIGHATWIAVNDLPAYNFGIETMNEYTRLNPDASISWMAFSYVSLASGVNLHPTYFGLYLTLCLLFLLYFFRSEEINAREKEIGRILIAFFLLFILFLSSRIATLTAIAVVLSALVMRVRPFSWRRVLRQQGIVLVACAAILYANPVSRYRDIQEPLTASLAHLPNYASRSIEVRLSLLRLTTLMGPGVNPVTGSGTGSAEDRLRAAGEQNGISNVLGSYDPHNQYIYTFLDLGAVGLLALLAMFVLPLIASVKHGSRVYAGLLFVFATICLTESALELQKGIILFTFFGSLLGFHEMRPQTQAAHHGK